MALHLTDDFTDLALHVLAHVRLREAGNLFDRRYVDWASDRTASLEEEWLHEGAEALERSWAQGAPPMVHAWPEVFESLEALSSVASVELSAVPLERARAPRVLESVRSAPGVELLHATICALMPWYAQWRREELEPRGDEAVASVRPWLEEAQGLLPALAKVRVELAWALGSRGRAFGTRIVVGVPAAWNGLDGRTPTVLAMHEHAVRGSGKKGYVAAEWAALTGLAAVMQRAPPPLRQAHAQWLAGLGLRPLLEAVVKAGWLDADDGERLETERKTRADALAALHER